jgi:hypothetical protein
MGEHFTKSTIEARAWCLKCNGMTMHRVDDGRKGPCLVCIAKLGEQVKKPREIEQQGFKF